MPAYTERGRPTKLTPERQHKIVQAIEAGCFLNVACSFAGVSYKVFREWMIRGENAKSGIYRDFRDAVESAEAKLEVRMVTQWQSQMKDDWRAIDPFMAKRFPERWGNTHKIQVQVEQQVAQEINLLFESIASDPDIPTEAKQRMFAAAAQLQERSSVAGEN